MFSKSLCSVMDELRLYKKQDYNTTTKQKDNMTTHKQQQDNMVINRWKLLIIFSPMLLYSIELCRQQVNLSVFLAIFLVQYFTFNYHHQALKTLLSSLAECRHFQGSWSAPRRSGSQAAKVWLMVDFRKLGQLQESFKMARMLRSLRRITSLRIKKMKDAQEHKLSSCFRSVSAVLDGFPTRHVFLRSKQNFSQRLV